VIGDDGTNNTWVEVSASGFAGAQGIQGPAGSMQGTQGVQGFEGPGTYTISATPPVAPETGDTWLDSDTGKLYIWDGIEWFEAYGNNDGLQGTQGVQGSVGIQGLNGLFAGQGVQGPQGLQGNQGLGLQGTQGLQGNQGPIGLSTNYDTIWVDTDLNQISPLLLMGA